MLKIMFCLLMVMGSVSLLNGQVKRIFVRVFNTRGEQLKKGILVGVTDSTLTVERDKVEFTIRADSVGLIKTKRTFGHGVLLGAGIGAITIGALAAVTAGQDDGDSFQIFDYSAGTGFAIGALSGAVTGGAIGALISAAQKRQTIVINGDMATWQKQKKIFE